AIACVGSSTQRANPVQHRLFALVSALCCPFDLRQGLLRIQTIQLEFSIYLLPARGLVQSHVRFPPTLDLFCAFQTTWLPLERSQEEVITVAHNSTLILDCE